MCISLHSVECNSVAELHKDINTTALIAQFLPIQSTLQQHPTLQCVYCRVGALLKSWRCLYVLTVVYRAILTSVMPISNVLQNLLREKISSDLHMNKHLICTDIVTQMNTLDRERLYDPDGVLTKDLHVLYSDSKEGAISQYNQQLMQLSGEILQKSRSYRSEYHLYWKDTSTSIS